MVPSSPELDGRSVTWRLEEASPSPLPPPPAALRAAPPPPKDEPLSSLPLLSRRGRWAGELRGGGGERTTAPLPLLRGGVGGSAASLASCAVSPSPSSPRSARSSAASIAPQIEPILY